MKRIFIPALMFFFVLQISYAQRSLEFSKYSYSQFFLKGPAKSQSIMLKSTQPSLDLSFLKTSRLVFVNMNGSSQVIYLIDDDGNVLNKGISNRPLFSNSQPALSISGNSMVPRDSMNPYGTSDLGSAIFLGTINSFIRLATKNKD